MLIERNQADKIEQFQSCSKLKFQKLLLMKKLANTKHWTQERKFSSSYLLLLVDVVVEAVVEAVLLEDLVDKDLLAPSSFA